MRHISFIGLIMSAGFLPYPLFGQDAEIEKLKPAVIHLVTDPDGASVFSKHSLIGTAPMDITYPVSSGKIRLLYPSASDWDAVEKEVDLTGVKPIQGMYRILLPKKICVQSIPYGAEVVEADSILGSTPFVYAMQKESASLILRKINYENSIVRLNRSEGNRITIPLKPLSTAFTEQLVTQHTTTFQMPGSSVILTASAGLAAGITSVVLKAHADKLCDQYLSTARNDLLSKTKTFDLYAGIALVLLQASVGYLVYLLLSD